MSCCLLIVLLMIGGSWSQATIPVTGVQPDSYWIYESNQYGDDLPCLRDGRCSVIARTQSNDDKKRNAGSDLVLLNCVQPSALFDGNIGTDIRREPQAQDLLTHYTWQAGIVPHPFVAMMFDPPLEVLTDVTLYLYREGRLDVRVPMVSMCVSSSLTFIPCTNVALPERPGFDNGVVIYDIQLQTPPTSVSSLNISFEHERGLQDDDDLMQWIFLSEVRVGGTRQQPPPPQVNSPVEPSSTQITTTTPSAAEMSAIVTPDPTTDRNNNSINATAAETSSEENKYRNKLIIGLTVSFIAIIAIVVFFVILILCLVRRHKKQEKSSTPLPMEVPFLVDGSIPGQKNAITSNGINKDIQKEPVHFSKKRLAKGAGAIQPSITDKGVTAEYCYITSPPPPPEYDYVGTQVNLFAEEIELDIYSSPDRTSADERQPSFDSEGYYSEPALETDTWTSSMEQSNHDYNEVALYHSVYADPEPLERSNPPLTVTWDNVKPLEALGSGQFGAVVLAEVLHLNEQDLGYNRDYANVCTPILVAVKTLKKDPSEQNKKAFEKEIKFMSRLNHKNIVRLVGICKKGTPFIMMEYMVNGDLNQFLKKHMYAPRYEMDTEGKSIANQKILVYISIQIASGMEYLSGRKFIHRDLATRNILVGKDFSVKVADFGMSQNLYSSYYFKVRGHQVLPVRWLPYESFKGKFSVKSDVWSYGVTMWEIFTICKKRPYQGWTDRAVIRDAMKAEGRTLLEQTEHCSDAVYSVMRSCWDHDPHQRSSFTDLYASLYHIYTRL